MYQPRDFIETHEGLVFAVVAAEPEDDRVLSSLRYIPADTQTGLQKLTGDKANHFLTHHYPHYLFYSKRCDVSLHAVAIQSIHKHHLPRASLAQLLDSNITENTENTHNSHAHTEKPLLEKVIKLLALMTNHGIDHQHIGITGSLLLGVQNHKSDIDLVMYDRALFFKTLSIIEQCIASQQLQALDKPLWLDAWQRRDCHLSFADFLWHEQRKFNKAAIDGTKFDLSLVTPSLPEDRQRYQKHGLTQIQARVTEDQFSFDYPARYPLDHKQIKEAVCFTQTYVGQARTGEQVELSGQLEISDNGQQRLLIGSSREARNEYIKVIQ